MLPVYGYLYLSIYTCKGCISILLGNQILLHAQTDFQGYCDGLTDLKAQSIATAPAARLTDTIHSSRRAMTNIDYRLTCLCILLCPACPEILHPVAPPLRAPVLQFSRDPRDPAAGDPLLALLRRSQLLASTSKSPQETLQHHIAWVSDEGELILQAC